MTGGVAGDGGTGGKGGTGGAGGAWVMNPWQAAEPAPPQKSLAVNTSEMMA